MSAPEPLDLDRLPRMVGRYRFPRDSWENQRDDCTNAVARRLREAARAQGGQPRGSARIDGTEEVLGEEAIEIAVDASIAVEVSP